MQVGYFIIIARTLGPADYGLFGGALAFIAIFSPFSMLGSGDLLIKHTSRNKDDFPKYWGASIATVLILGSLFTFIIVLIYKFFLPSSLNVVTLFVLCLSDLILLRFIDISSQAFQAFELIFDMNKVQTIMYAVKFASALILFIPGLNHSVDTWALLYFLSNVISSTFAVMNVNHVLGKGIFDPRPIYREAKEGFHFAVGYSTSSIYNDIDKTMLAKFSTLESTGIYVAAYRLIDMSMTPIRALLTSTYTRFFREGKQGRNGTAPLVKKILPYSISYAIFTCTMIWLFAWLIPMFIGKDYDATVVALKWLSPIIFLRSIHSVIGDSLSGAGFQGIRSRIQIIVAILNVGLNLYVIPVYGWVGAVGSSIVSDLLLLILLGMVFINFRLNSIPSLFTVWLNKEKA